MRLLDLIGGSMLPWRQLGLAEVPGHKAPLRLMQRGEEFVIRIGTSALMSSEAHGSEDALAELACARIAGRAGARVLVGGLGMGFTLRAALQRLRPDAKVEVAELIPAVVEWNRGPLAHLADQPLADGRVTVRDADVRDCIREARGTLDAILLDVDNGPNGLTRATNDRLYDATGLTAAYGALRPGGVFAVWSVEPDRAFARRLGTAGFEVREEVVRARRTKGGRHTVWLASRPRRG